MKNKGPKPRNPYVAPAKRRGGAGPMEDRRKPRGGPRNTFREDLENWEEEKKQQTDESPTAEDSV